MVWALLISGRQVLILPLCNFWGFWGFGLFVCLFFNLEIVFNVVLSLKLHILLSHSGTFEFILGFASLKQKDLLLPV